MNEILIGYLSLFLSAFGAATLLPLQSEALLIALLISEKYSTVLLLMIATFGNVLGACVNWWLGIKIETYRDRKWFPISEQKLDQAQNLYAKYGSPILLLSWLPIIGDPITLVSGVLKENFLRFLCFVAVAKFLRYLVIYLAYSAY